MYNKYEYPNIKNYYNNLSSESKEEVIFDLKQLKGLVLDQIIVADMEDFLINNITLILNHLDNLIAQNMLEKMELLKLKTLIREDVLILKCNDELSYGSKRVFGEYMNYIYNIVDFMDKC